MQYPLRPEAAHEQRNTNNTASDYVSSITASVANLAILLLDLATFHTTLAMFIFFYYATFDK